MSMDEEAIAAGLRRLRINKQLSAVKVALGPLGFGKDLGSHVCGNVAHRAIHPMTSFMHIELFRPLSPSRFYVRGYV